MNPRSGNKGFVRGDGADECVWMRLVDEEWMSVDSLTSRVHGEWRNSFAQICQPISQSRCSVHKHGDQWCVKYVLRGLASWNRTDDCRLACTCQHGLYNKRFVLVRSANFFLSNSYSLNELGLVVKSSRWRIHWYLIWHSWPSYCPRGMDDKRALREFTMQESQDVHNDISKTL